MTSRLLLSAAILLAGSQAANADYVDVITNEMNPDCTMEQYLETVEEFRGVMTAQGYTYTVEILVPVEGENLSSVYWVGRTADFATFGAEYTKWLAGIAKSGSPEAKMNAKLNKCATNLSRSGSLTQ
jgi:hypothetical protein